MKHWELTADRLQYVWFVAGLFVMKTNGISIFSFVAACLWSAILPTKAQVNVVQFHNHASRDGLYVDGVFTQSAAANLTRDINFDGTIVGNVYAQPLYVEGGPSGPMIIAVTESNNVYALDAVDGTIIWWRNVGPPVPLADLQCPPNLIPWASPARLLSIFLRGRSFWTR